MPDHDPEAVFNAHKDRYLESLRKVFLPLDPIRNDIICYFSSLLRVLGMEDAGWDPYAESRATLEDLNQLMKLKHPREKISDPEGTIWRLGLLLYSHIVEMDAPYEVITNLLRYQLGKGYNPNPYFDFLTEKEKKSFAKSGIRTGRKIEIIKQLSEQAKLKVGNLFDEFYDNRLRNAVQHSDFILAQDDFRSRSGIKSFRVSYEELDEHITKAKAFIAAYFEADYETRRIWGRKAGNAIPYDRAYKGLMEVIADDDGLMCGFAVHWPNESQSLYKRTEKGIDMCNCMIEPSAATLSLFVGTYARNPGSFSPLVEKDGMPLYPQLIGASVRPEWPEIYP